VVECLGHVRCGLSLMLLLSLAANSLEGPVQTPLKFADLAALSLRVFDLLPLPAKISRASTRSGAGIRVMRTAVRGRDATPCF
jgi:hypothetical protein